MAIRNLRKPDGSVRLVLKGDELFEILDENQLLFCGEYCIEDTSELDIDGTGEIAGI